jgi:FkbM family methyltransferase
VLAETRETEFVNRYLREVIRSHVERRLLSLVVRPNSRGLTMREHGDVLIPNGVIDPDWICYCAGVGEDIRFERYLAESIGARVWAFDPTPRAIRFMETSSHDRQHLQFLPFGVWKEDTTLRFNAPENPEHVSHTVMGDIGGTAYFDAPCRSIASLMRELGHSRVDLLKMNIEGAEHIVLDEALRAGIRPKIIALTWEGDSAFFKARNWTARLRAEGYELIGRWYWFFTYFRIA